MTARREVSVEQVLERAKAEPTFDLPFAGAAFGMGEASAYKAVADGTFPVPVIRAGRNIRVPSAEVLRVLGREKLPPESETP
jgi:predicted DNA-binding transcriptional regulator AlpA